MIWFSDTLNAVAYLVPLGEPIRTCYDIFIELFSNGHILTVKFYSRIMNGLEEPPNGFQQKKDALVLLADSSGCRKQMVLERHQ